ncbi:unnamed protein product [Closterium sp. NIES-64]|nr:unnamed protein product [Closterium sp. NIES-64]
MRHHVRYVRSQSLATCPSATALRPPATLLLVLAALALALALALSRWRALSAPTLLVAEPAPGGLGEQRAGVRGREAGDGASEGLHGTAERPVRGKGSEGEGEESRGGSAVTAEGAKVGRGEGDSENGGENAGGENAAESNAKEELRARAVAAAAAATTAAAAAAGVVARPLRLVVVHGAAAVGAGETLPCAVRSPPAYYFRPGHAGGAHKWFFHFQGGAWCSSGEECRQRSLTALGSSRLLPATADAEGVFSDDPAINPGMHEWNMVKLAYCDGGSFAGHRTHPLPVQGGSIFIRGRAIRDAIFDHLQHRLAHAQQVVVSGCSAGGLAALLHCDHIRATFFPALPPSAYACLPDAAIFLDRKDLGGKATARELFQAVFQFHHMAGGVSEHCINARPLHLQYECVFARHAMAYVSSRVFMVNSNYDSWNLLALLANEDADPSGDLLRNCLYRVRSCTAAQLAIIQDFRQALLESWQPFLAASDPHGAFFYSCFAHCATYHSDLWSQLTVANHTLAQAFSLWLHEEDNDGAEAKSVDCAYPCNECSIDRPEFREPAVFF